MRSVNILLEGDKDVYFLHEFVLRRFPAFVREDNPILKRLVRNRPTEMRSRNGEVKLFLYSLQGYKNLSTHGELLVKRADVEGDFTAVVIFDADSPAFGDDGGFSNRRDALRKMIEYSRRVEKWLDSQLFLFPNNKDDGDLEVLMERMVADTDAHRSFLNVCWRNFKECVERHNFNTPTQKSKLNEYTAAFNNAAWHDGGINAAFSDDTLWNWNAVALVPLHEFLMRVVVGVEGLGVSTEELGVRS